MTTQSSSNPRRRIPTIMTLLGMVAFGVLSCTLSRFPHVEPHGWWSGRGPVVPHESFPADCTLCHLGESWNEIREELPWDHSAETGVELVGAHAEAECLRCHNDRGPVAMFAQRGCVGCHEDRHRGQLGSNCESCHGQENWNAKDAIVAHQRTRFPLLGAHAAVDCSRCHPGALAGEFTRADTECISCHRDDLSRATNPDHMAQGWVAGCDRCHMPTTWAGEGFNHATFPLTGRHREADCSACHVAGVFTGTPRDCVDCHLAEYQGAQDPNHVQLGFSTVCNQCHTTLGWDGAQFNHAGIVDGCVQCHLADYQGAGDPDHVGLGFSTSCETCHSTKAWIRASFDHQGIVDGCVQCHLADYQGVSDPDHVGLGFPTACESCHLTSGWTRANFDHTGVVNGCAQCHLPEYQGAQDPDHVGLGFPTTCESCHLTSGWSRASFDHAGITRGCAQCHLADYQGASDPNHIAAGFPTSCETCHITTGWDPATFTHVFPIVTDDHKGFACDDCHLQPSSFQNFSCIHCHDHSQSEMADEHDRVGGYVWASPACVQCHPNGQAR